MPSAAVPLAHHVVPLGHIASVIVSMVTATAA
jgi:hypothetical protein